MRWWWRRRLVLYENAGAEAFPRAFISFFLFLSTFIPPLLVKASKLYSGIAFGVVE